MLTEQVLILAFELLDSPVGVATWNTTNTHDTDRWAIIASNYTDSVTVVSLSDPSNTSVTDTLVTNFTLVTRWCTCVLKYLKSVTVIMHL